MKISRLFSLAVDYYNGRDICPAMVSHKFQLLGSGKDRYTWLSPNKRYVIKFPKHEDGIYANQNEAKYYAKYKNQPDHNGVVFAPCRLIAHSILLMQAMVSTLGDTSGCIIARDTEAVRYCMDTRPDWVDHIDCDQVGKLMNGRMATYDYGDYFGD